MGQFSEHFHWGKLDTTGTEYLGWAFMWSGGLDEEALACSDEGVNIEYATKPPSDCLREVLGTCDIPWTIKEPSDLYYTQALRSGITDDGELDAFDCAVPVPE